MWSALLFRVALWRTRSFDAREQLLHATKTYLVHFEALNKMKALQEVSNVLDVTTDDEPQV